MLFCIFSHFIQTQNICYHLWMEFFLSCSRNFSYLVYHFYPALVIKFMLISDFHLFVIMFGFPNRFILVPLSIIITSFKSDPSFFTCFIPCKLVCDPLQLLVFALDTLTSSSLSTACSSSLYFFLLVMNFHIYCPFKPLIYFYCIHDLKII